MRYPRMRLVLPFLLLFTAAGCGAQGTDILLHVIDDDGNPVVGADVHRVFFREQLQRRQLDLPQPGRTDQDGTVRIVGPEDTDVDVSATLNGWYPSRRKILLDEGMTDAELRMRRKRNPIVMAVRRIELLHELKPGEGIGYDLMIGDFVAPHGGGLSSDLVFDYVSRTGNGLLVDFELTVRFSREHDGIQPVEFSQHQSELRSDYEAPEDGYQGSLHLWEKVDHRAGISEGNYAPDANYFVRVRSRVTEDGRIRGHYGKLYGGFAVFTHYLNPTFGDRNVEWDPDRNLIAPARGEQRPTAP